MAEEHVAVRILPLGRECHVPKGTRWVNVARQVGLALNLPCGGEGICGKCRLLVREGDCPITEADRKHLAPQDLAQGFRLACQLVIDRPLVVQIPDSLLLKGSHQILTQTGKVALRRDTPLVVKKAFEWSSQLGPEMSLWDGLAKALPHVQCPLPVMRDWAAAFDEIPRQAVAALADGMLLAVETPQSGAETLGLAVDLGTTTLVAALVDLEEGAELAVAARLNPQIEFGDDVISRIQRAGEQSWGTERLQQAVVGALNEMLEEVLAEATASRGEVYQVVCAGNTTMQHLFCGLCPRELGRFPFRPVHSGSLSFFADEVGLRIHPRGRVYVFPVIGGFVGGDTVAGIVTTELFRHQTPALLIDLGTNGEIVLQTGNGLQAAATAAGPAFEGARITAGMRATRGAIERVWFDEAHQVLRYQVIGDDRPVGLCGSAMLDLLAVLRNYGLLTPEGRLQPGRRSEIAAQDLCDRFIELDGVPSFVVARAEETSHGNVIALTQRDIRQLQLAIGAIRAGTEILLNSAGLSASQLGAVYLAGGFGNYIRRCNAQLVGLLPRDVPSERIQFWGNTSLLGAKMILLSRELRGTVEQVARSTAHVDLAAQPGFATHFAEAMIFPALE